MADPVSMKNGDVLPNKDVSYQWQSRYHDRHSHLVVEWTYGKIVHLHSMLRGEGEEGG